MNKNIPFYISIVVLIISFANCKDSKRSLLEFGSQTTSGTFQVVDEKKNGPSGKTIWSISIILSKSNYSRDKLEKIFKLFSEKYPDENERLRVYIFTSIEDWRKEKNAPPYTPVVEKETSTKVQEFNTHAMAIFYRPNTSDINNDGEFIRYFFSPDLNDPNVRQKLILKNGFWITL